MKLYLLATAIAVLAASVWIFAFAPPARAADFDKAARAYATGDFEKAAEEWRQLAEAGDVTAQFNLALLHDNPQSGLFDSSKSATWYKRAAAQGLGAAQFNLAVAYQTGRGVPIDMENALFWLLIAADAEDTEVGSRASGAASVFGLAIADEERTRAMRRAGLWQAVPESVAPDKRPYMTLSESDVMAIQRRLTELGRDPGAVDGVAGVKTQQAIAAYFKDRGGKWRHGPLSHDLLEILD